MNEHENRNALTPGGRLADFRNAGAAARARLAVGEAPRVHCEYKAPRRIPFDGLLTNKLLAALPGADFARFLPHLEPVSLPAGQNLYEFGDAADCAYFPETAVVSHVYVLEDGRTTSAAIVGKEGMIGLSAVFGSRPPSYWTQVTIGGSALRVGVEFLKEEFARGGALQQLVLGYAGARLAQLSQRAVCNGRHSVEERLCTWLLMIYDRTGDEPLPLTHEEIAHHLGARRAGITTACTDLRDNGFIEYGRGRISVFDRQGLESAACECYRALRRATEQTQRAGR